MQKLIIIYDQASEKSSCEKLKSTKNNYISYLVAESDEASGGEDVVHESALRSYFQL